MEVAQEEHKKEGLIATLAFHLILLLWFAFYGLTYLDPPPEEEGITINFGTTDFGRQSPNETPVSEQLQEETETEQTETSPTETVEEDVLTQSSEEAPAMEKKEEKKEEKTEEVKEEPKPDKNLSKALDKWKNKNSQPSGGDGTTDQSGDQGALDGDPNSNNYVGSGKGNGIGFSLSGRAMVKKPIIKDDSQNEGTVVVDIIVDQKGKVLRATPGARGSTTTSPVLYKRAKEAALRTLFSANPDAAEQQKGQMTFTFILN